MPKTVIPLLLGCCLFAAVCSADEPLTRNGIDAFYHAAWQEIVRSSSEPLKKPRLQPIHVEDLPTPAGVYVLDYGGRDFGDALLTIRKQSWTLKQEGDVQTGHWRLIGDKIVLLRGRSSDDLPALVLRVGGHWYFNDADLLHGITPLKPKS